MPSRARDLLIATLGTEPQVVTIAVDGLRQKGYPIAEVRVVHTAAEAVNDALTVLAREFERGAYPGVVLRIVPVIGAEGPLDDFRDERAVSELLGDPLP
jgi:CRISPR-associated protein Csx14